MPRPAGDTVTDADGSASWRALGTLVQLVVTDPRCLAEARRLLTADLAEVDLACSRFRADSEICGLRTTGGRPARISPLLAEAIAVALRAASLTDGDVDPTVGAAMSAVGYDRDFEQVQPVGPPLALTVRTVPGWREVHLEGQSLTMPAGVQLDLGATAKAWAADRSAARITSRLGCGVLVSLGGDIAVAGPAPQGGWRIRVQDVTGSPADPPAGPYALIAIRDGGLATSSTAARRWQRGGDVLHHILDPRTGLPADAVLAYRLGRGEDLRRRQRGQHGCGHPRSPGAGLAGAARPPGPAGGHDRRGVHRGRLARRVAPRRAGARRPRTVRGCAEVTYRLRIWRSPKMDDVNERTDTKDRDG